jgi:TolB protein
VIGLAVALPGIVQPAPLPTFTLPPPTPTATLRPTLSFSQQQQTIDASRITRVPTATFAAPFVTQIRPIEPTWTPAPTQTPEPSQTPTATSFPLANLTLLFAGEGRGRASSGIYTIQADGKNEKLLIAQDARAFDPVWSPDGRQIAFITVVDGKEQLAIADADGSNVRVLTSFTGRFTRTPAFAPDGKTLLVVSDQDGNDALYTVAVESAESTTTAPTRLTPDKFDHRDPAWSPDGKRIVYAADPSGRGSYQIFTVNPDGTDRRQFTESQYNNITPSYSPDGSRIVFVSTRDRKANIYVMTADGEDEQLLSLDDGGAENRDPAFSPDGRWIAFSATRGGTIYNLFVMAADGTQVQQVTDQKNVSTGPHFQPTR